ncbi:hypothetical protein [Mesorhizobium sp. M1396]|uniref:hypothetical protein n=1 Tax=Mesorhizobium sp. M1396 TaxID=2957095 RepID=UPI0033372248
MRFESALERSFAIVDRTLRQSFREDYYKRCMYAAFGMQSLLTELGYPASIQGGDVLAFMVARSGNEAGLQGFANASDGHAHYWTVAENRLIDIGPYYLPRESSFSAVQVPLIAWSTFERLPPFLRYRVAEDFGRTTILVADESIQQRMAKFIELCRRKLKQQIGQPKPPNWILTGTAALLSRGERGDPWARNAMLFSTMPGTVENLPF